MLTVGQSLLGSAELGVLLFASQNTAIYLTAALLNRFAGVRSVKPGSAALASPAPPRLDEILADAAITSVSYTHLTMDYNKADFIASYGISSQLPESDRPELSFSGRSNVGKSSLIKMCIRDREGAGCSVKRSRSPGCPVREL